jgi:hypothetical protein
LHGCVPVLPARVHSWWSKEVVMKSSFKQPRSLVDWHCIRCRVWMTGNESKAFFRWTMAPACCILVYLSSTYIVCCAKIFGIYECPWIKDGPPLSDTLDFSSQWSYWSCSSRMWLRLNHHTVLPVVLSFFNLIGIRIPFLGNFDVYISELLHITHDI